LGLEDDGDPDFYATIMNTAKAAGYKRSCLQLTETN
jgi:hypothetical protein